MATDNHLKIITLLAGADLSSSQYRFMRYSAARTATFCNAIGMDSCGVSQDDPDTAGYALSVGIGGLTRLETGAAVAAGADVACDALGRGITALAGYTILAEAIDASAGAGEVITVRLKLSGAALFGVEYHTPGNIETAAFTAAVDATWEDVDVVALINTALVTGSIETGQRVRLRCVMEIADSAGAAVNVRYADGETPDNDDTMVSITTAGAVASEFFEADLVTDASGQIKIETAAIADITFILHLKGFSYVHPTAVA